MRTEIVKADGWEVTVRGRTRRTLALESEYLLVLKSAHPEMGALVADPSVPAGEVAARDPHGWSLVTSASQFRYLAARVQKVEFANGHHMDEPFTGKDLVELFDHYLDAEQMPDGSDIWSLVEDAIQAVDHPPKESDPNAEGGTEKK